MNENYIKFQAKISKIADISYAISVLNWDQETYMPKKGVKMRSQQISTLSAMAHELRISKDFGALLAILGKATDLTEIQRKNVELTTRDYSKWIKLPTEFVVRLSDATSIAFHAWLKAREENDFSLYVPALENMVALQKEKAEIYGYDNHPYDALMDDYEPGAQVAEIDALFEDVKSQLGPYTKAIFDKSTPNNKFMYQYFEHAKQWGFGIDILKQMGYDMDAGRQDISEHPFTTSFGPEDVRVTTRVDENNFYDMLWSCIHEGGHALYEQGLNTEQYGMPCGEATSLGIHESQSRLYENNVGRSFAFWKHNYSNLQAVFPDQFGKVDLNEFYKGINVVSPSLIRTDADELTYHFHIMIRYEIEKKLIEGSIAVKDLDTVWNKAYKDYLGIDVPSDKEGVLQDIHWAHGGFGYFPTYSLGSFYAAQFLEFLKQNEPSIVENFNDGKLQPLLEWLRENIHQHGRRFTSKELCEKATGEPLKFSYFMAYAKDKYNKIYELGE